MTCIAGLVHEGEVWLASDAQMGWSGKKIDCGSKIIQHGDLSIAFCGYAGVMSAFKNRFSLPGIPEDQSEHDKWMRVTVPDAINQCMKDAGIMKNVEGRNELDAFGIMGWRGRLCCLDDSMMTYDSDRPFMALGSGGDVAIGSLYSTEDKGPEERLNTAINAANMWSVGCGCGVHVVRAGKKG